ncbi:MAG: class I SAM-dependent DNA methyltransferase, partial [Anaerolineales bacterium]
MQAYGPAFARVYQQRWRNFAQQVAPHIFDFYTRSPIGQVNRAALDLACGTGQLAHYLLERGFRVTGLDLSAAMLEYARENTEPYIDSGQARFEQVDITRFAMADEFGLIVSTFDALNHLADFDALHSCFRSVYPALADDGWFIFDLNTRAGLQRWNNLSVDESDDAILITRGVYAGHGERAWMRISGCVRVPGGKYERFEETVFNTAFDLNDVQQALVG